MIFDIHPLAQYFICTTGLLTFLCMSTSLLWLYLLGWVRSELKWLLYRIAVGQSFENKMLLYPGQPRVPWCKWLHVMTCVWLLSHPGRIPDLCPMFLASRSTITLNRTKQDKDECMNGLHFHPVGHSLFVWVLQLERLDFAFFFLVLWSTIIFHQFSEVDFSLRNPCSI